MEAKRKEKNKNLQFLYISIIILIILLVGMSFAIYRTILKSNDPIKAEIPMISFTYKEPDYELSSTRMSDETGKSQSNYYEFTISSENKNNMMLKYYIFAEEETGNNIDSKYIKVYLTDENNNPVGRFKNTNASLYLNSLDNNNSENLKNLIDNMCLKFKNGLMYDCDSNSSVSAEIKYRLRYWISDEFDIKPNVTTTGNEHTVKSEDYIYKFKVNVLVSES